MEAQIFDILNNSTVTAGNKQYQHNDNKLSIFCPVRMIHLSVFNICLGGLRMYKSLSLFYFTMLIFVSYLRELGQVSLYYYSVLGTVIEYTVFSVLFLSVFVIILTIRNFTDYVYKDCCQVKTRE